MTTNATPRGASSAWCDRAFELAPPSAQFTRKKLPEKLEELGFKTTEGTLQTKACRGGAPPYRLYGRLCIYEWQDVIERLKAEIGEPAPNAAAHKSRRLAAVDVPSSEAEAAR
jgi:hypothetical protein